MRAVCVATTLIVYHRIYCAGRITPVMSRCLKRLFEQFYRTFKGFPCVMTARHVAGVKTRISQGGSALAANVKAVHAERHHGYFLRQGTNPFIDVLGITPDRAVEDVMGPRTVVARARVDDLHGPTGSQH